MKSRVYLWEDGTFEIEKNCVPDDCAEQIMYGSIRDRRGILKVCMTSKIDVAKKELAQSVVDGCNEQIREVKKKRNKFQKILDSLSKRN